jgi:hypothetical protein
VIALIIGRRAGVKSAYKEPGLGASSSDGIELVAVDEKSKVDRNRIRGILKKG